MRTNRLSALSVIGGAFALMLAACDNSDRSNPWPFDPISETLICDDLALDEYDHYDFSDLNYCEIASDCAVTGYKRPGEESCTVIIHDVVETDGINALISACSELEPCTLSAFGAGMSLVCMSDTCSLVGTTAEAVWIPCGSNMCDASAQYCSVSYPGMDEPSLIQYGCYDLPAACVAMPQPDCSCMSSSACECQDAGDIITLSCSLAP